MYGRFIYHMWEKHKVPYKVRSHDFAICILFWIRRHSVYYLVDEVLRCDEIMPDENNKLTFRFFFSFFPLTFLKNKGYFFKTVHKYYAIYLKRMIFSRCEPERKNCYFYFFFLRQGGKIPCRTPLTKQYTECHLRGAHVSLKILFNLSLVYKDKIIITLQKIEVLMHK